MKHHAEHEESPVNRNLSVHCRRIFPEEHRRQIANGT